MTSRKMLAAAVFTALAVFSTYPLVLHLDTAVPGTGPGDNLASLWNTWWFQQALARQVSPFRTDLLFAPLGTQLSLHTHASTHALLAWPWTTVTSVTSAHNIAILIGLTLNGYVTFLLAHRLAGSTLPALIAGWLVATSAFVHMHLLGHMNLLHAWVIPAFILALLRLASAPAVGSALRLGVAGALVVYTDYYFAIYCGLITLVWTVVRLVVFSSRPASAGMRTASRLLFTLAGAACAVAVAIVASGGFVLDLGAARVSMRTARNPLNVAWLALLIGILLRSRVWFSIRRDEPLAPKLTGYGALAMVVGAALLSPLLVALAEVMSAGDYTSPRVLWRSSPPGGDLSTVLLGHPAHALTAGLTLRWYEQLGIDPIEESLWLGLMPLVLLAAWRRTWWPDRAAGRWIVLAIVFGILAAGPFLRVGGIDTGLTLPQAALRYVPGISNARMPGRAVVVVQLAVAMLLAVGWSRRRPATATSFGLLGLVLLDSVPGPSVLYHLPRADRVDAALTASAGPGAVVELPTGVRDGLDYTGDFDHRALVHQMVHGRPLAGGFVARLSPSISLQYDQDPVLRQFVALSRPGGPAIALPGSLAADAAARGLRFVVVNRDRLAEERLSRIDLEAAGFRFLVADGPRQLFASSTR